MLGLRVEEYSEHLQPGLTAKIALLRFQYKPELVEQEPRQMVESLRLCIPSAAYSRRDFAATKKSSMYKHTV